MHNYTPPPRERSLTALESSLVAARLAINKAFVAINELAALDMRPTFEEQKAKEETHRAFVKKCEAKNRKAQEGLPPPQIAQGAGAAFVTADGKQVEPGDVICTPAGAPAIVPAIAAGSGFLTAPGGRVWPIEECFGSKAARGNRDE